jgi:hypothetical protein
MLHSFPVPITLAVLPGFWGELESVKTMIVERKRIAAKRR